MFFRFLGYWLGTIGFFNVCLALGYGLGSFSNDASSSVSDALYLLPVWKFEAGIIPFCAVFAFAVMVKLDEIKRRHAAPAA